MPDLVLMKKYGLVKNGVVQSSFYSDKNPSEYPDIEPYLMELPEEVNDNWHYIAGVFVEPYQVDDLDGQNQVAEIKPWWKFW